MFNLFNSVTKNVTTSTWKNIKSTYYKALKEINKLPAYKDTLEIHRKTFAGCVSLFCHDDIDLDIDVRATYLLKLVGLSGGPTVREHYAHWKAFGKGDAIRKMDNKYEMTSFELDPRFKKPGTWTYKESFDFCLKTVFEDINVVHKFISTVEDCYDDPEVDLKALKAIELPSEVKF